MMPCDDNANELSYGHEYHEGDMGGTTTLAPPFLRGSENRIRVCYVGKLMQKRVTLLLLPFVPVAGVGCHTTQKHYVKYYVQTHPFSGDVYINGSRGHYYHLITDADIAAGEVRLPDLTVKLRGYQERTISPDPIRIDAAFLRSVTSYSAMKYAIDGSKHYKEDIGSPGMLLGFGGYCNLYHGVKYPEILSLCNDPYYYSESNKVNLTLDARPGPAEIFSEGKSVGNTPLTLTYNIDRDAVQRGKIVCAPLVAYREGSRPQMKQFTLDIDASLRYQENRTITYNGVFFLESDPNYRPPAQVVYQQSNGGTTEHHVVVEKKDSFLDQALKFGQLMLIGQTLQPIR